MVGAVILDEGHVLATRRSRPPELAGRWEFPGGKVEPGESPEAALVREIREELLATVTVGEEVTDDGSPWPISATLELRLFAASIVDGVARSGGSHDALRWLSVADLDSVDWLPSDRTALRAVRAVLRG